MQICIYTHLSSVNMLVNSQSKDRTLFLVYTWPGQQYRTCGHIKCDHFSNFNSLQLMNCLLYLNDIYIFNVPINWESYKTHTSFIVHSHSKIFITIGQSFFQCYKFCRCYNVTLIYNKGTVPHNGYPGQKIMIIWQCCMVLFEGHVLQQCRHLSSLVNQLHTSHSSIRDYKLISTASTVS